MLCRVSMADCDRLLTGDVIFLAVVPDAGDSGDNNAQSFVHSEGFADIRLGTTEHSDTRSY